MKIIEVLSNDGNEVLFKSDEERILVPKAGFQQQGNLQEDYPIGLQAVPASFWETIKRNGERIAVQ